MRAFSAVFLVCLTALSCNFFKSTDDRIPVARVNDTYLFEETLLGLVPEETSKEDSIALVQNFINRWATQQLLFDGAKLNLSDSKQLNFDNLVEQYRNDLYAKAYLEALVARSIDTSVGKDIAREYYEENKEVFKLNEELIKFRYIHIDESMNNYNQIEEMFKRFNAQDKKELDSISIQFKSYSLNDSIWVKVSQVISKVPQLNSSDKDKLLKKSNFIQLKDSLGLYLMQVNDVLLRNEIAPLAYVKPTIDQIVINKRKLELIKQIEKDITKDAIKNKQFEIFN